MEWEVEKPPDVLVDRSDPCVGWEVEELQGFLVNRSEP